MPRPYSIGRPGPRGRRVGEKAKGLKFPVIRREVNGPSNTRRLTHAAMKLIVSLAVLTRSRGDEELEIRVRAPDGVPLAIEGSRRVVGLPAIAHQCDEFLDSPCTIRIIDGDPALLVVAEDCGHDVALRHAGQPVRRIRGSWAMLLHRPSPLHRPTGFPLFQSRPQPVHAVHSAS